MERLAYSQQLVSEKQRDEAETQKRIADKLRKEAEQQAVSLNIAKKELEKSFAIAEENRKESEKNKGKSDTLAMINVGLFLITKSLQEYNAAHYEIARLCMLAGWEFFSMQVKDVKGEKYISEAVYAASSRLSGLDKEIKAHDGAVRSIAVIRDEEKVSSFVSVADDGSVVLWNYEDYQPSYQTLYKNKKLNFRRVFYWEEKDWIVASSNEKGTFVIFYGKGYKKHFEYTESLSVAEMFCMEDNIYFITEEGELYTHHVPNEESFHSIKKGDIKSKMIYKHNCPISSAYFIPKRRELFFGDEEGVVYQFDFSKCSATKYFVDRKEAVTSIFFNDKKDLVRFGYRDGYYCKIMDGKIIRSVPVHTSRITGIQQIDIGALFSSYDGTISLVVKSELKNGHRVVKFYACDGWVYTLVGVKKQNFFLCGTSTGDVCILCTDVEKMIESIRNASDREFTKDEWNTYVGKDFEYRTFKR